MRTVRRTKSIIHINISVLRKFLREGLVALFFFPSGTSKPSRSTIAVFQFGNKLPLGGFMAGDDHLCDALSVIDHKSFVRKIYQKYFYLAAIIRINSAGRI